MPQPRLDLTGQKFGKLTVLKPGEDIISIKNNGQRRVTTHWICRCTCGNKLTVRTSNLRTKQKACYDCKKTTHGQTKNPLYKVWWDMLFRCYNPTSPWYHRYGGRGIKVCKEWRIKENNQGLLNFIAWNESLPVVKRYKPGLQLDRIKNSKSYKPSNCKWSTPKENSNNRG